MPAVKVLAAMVHTPVLALAVVEVPVNTPSLYSLTVAPLSAVPVKLGVVALVMLSPATLVSLAATKVGAPGAVGATVSMAMVLVAVDDAPLITCVALTSKLLPSPAKVLRWAALKAAVVQLPPVAVTGVMVTLAPVAVLVRVTVTVAPLVAVPLRVGVSLPLMMLSVAKVLAMATAVAGAKLVSMLMLRLPALEVTPETVCRAVTTTLPVLPKAAMSAAVRALVAQVVVETVAVLLTLAPVLLLVSTTLTVAPEVQVPVTVRVPALTSLRLMMLSVATASMVGTAKVLMLMRGVVPAPPLLSAASV